MALASYRGYMWRMRSAENSALRPARCFEKPTGPDEDGRDPINGWRTNRGLAGDPLRPRPRRGTHRGTHQVVGGGSVKPMDEAVAHDNKLYVM
ncbi:hypothetical protein [Streptomyces nojiriensis]|uniref:hypothetical protein n=1 Tax=Streptomyces nojiriensis TaxID=66374 RepID=UPI0035E24B56